MKVKKGHKIVFMLIIGLMVIGLFWGAFQKSISEQKTPISKNSFLELIIAGEVPERAVDDPILKAFNGSQILSVQDLLQMIRKAKMDKKITGMILRPVSLAMGWGKVAEVRNALLEFKEAGKPIYAYLEMAEKKEFYLASVADSILGISNGVLSINGFLSEPVFLKETLFKVGIEADFVAHGKYKNAPDIFTRKNMSQPQRQVINELLDDFYSHWISTIAEARNKKKTEIQKLIDKGLFSLKEAKEKGLVDTLMYYQEFKNFLKKKDKQKLRFVPSSRYRKVSFKSLGISAQKSIAVIYGVGTIVIGGEGKFGEDGLITSEGMANAIRKAANNKRIKAIILRIDSPGGSGIASDIIWWEVVEAKKKKPVIVSISDVAASGGYYISMAADSIIAHPNSIVGSIGVFAGKFSWKEFYRKTGIKSEKILRGKNADFFSPNQKFTLEQQRILRKYIMDFYQEFITKAAEGRKLSLKEIDKVSQGRVWTGKRGFEIGLVDRLGDFQTAVQMAKRMAKLPEDKPVKLEVYPKLKSFFEKALSGNIKVEFNTLFPVVKDLPVNFRTIVTAVPYFQVGEPLSLWPYSFKID